MGPSRCLMIFKFQIPLVSGNFCKYALGILLLTTNLFCILINLFLLVQENYNKILSNQEIIMRDLAAMHVKFDNLVDILIKDRSSATSQEANVPDNNLELDIKKMVPITSEAEMINLEKNLRNKEFEKAFISFLLSVIIKMYVLIFIFILDKSNE